MASYRIAPSACPCCGAVRTAIDRPGSAPRAPMPGDAVVCMVCGAITTVDAAGNPAPFTEAQIVELQRDPAIMEQLVMDTAMIQARRRARHGTN